MPLEIERRFLARVDPELLRDAPATRQRQGYLTARDPTVLRIREEGARWVLAVKADAGGIARHEIEVEVSAEDGRALMAVAIGGTLEKTRYDVGRWEIDVYEGRFEGLTVAEFELDAEDEEVPEPPPGLELLREITYESGLSSRRLAGLDEVFARDLVARLTAPAT